MLLSSLKNDVHKADKKKEQEIKDGKSFMLEKKAKLLSQLMAAI